MGFSGFGCVFGGFVGTVLLGRDWFVATLLLLPLVYFWGFNLVRCKLFTKNKFEKTNA